MILAFGLVLELSFKRNIILNGPNQYWVFTIRARVDEAAPGAVPKECFGFFTLKNPSVIA